MRKITHGECTKCGSPFEMPSRGIRFLCDYCRSTHKITIDKEAAEPQPVESDHRRYARFMWDVLGTPRRLRITSN